jgi:hypothetical protein
MTKEVATVGNTAMARPSFIPEGRKGAENIRKEDMQLPVLRIAQGLSPELEQGNPKFIDGLKVGDIYNSLTNTIYGKGPLTIVVVRADRPKGIEFRPREEGGGIIDPNVPLDDPRMEWGEDGEKPQATKFYEYVTLLVPIDVHNPMGSLVMLSLKSSGIKLTAKPLNGLIGLRNDPIYSMRYTLESVVQKFAKGSAGVFKVAQLGYIEDQATYQAAESVYNLIKDVTFKVEREPGSDDGEDDTLATDVKSEM